MIMLRRCYMCLLALVLTPLALSAQEKDADVLVISSQIQYSEWAQQMLHPVYQLEKERPDLTFRYSYLRVLSYTDAKQLQDDFEATLCAQENPPGLVVMNGASCFSLAVRIQKRWPDVPILCLGSQEYYSDLEDALLRAGDPHIARHPITDLRKKGCNMTLIDAPIMRDRTVRMIRQIQPDLDHLFILCGENYQSQENLLFLEQYLKENHSDLPHEIIHSHSTTTDSLINLLEKERGHKTAVLFLSWLVREGYDESVNTRYNTVQLIENIVPVYYLYPCDMAKHPYVVGYYSIVSEEYERNVAQRMLDVLDYGYQPKNMPFSHLFTGAPVINYDALEHFGLDPEELPDDVILYNAPQSLWKRYKKQIMWAAFFLLIGIAGFIYHTMRRSMRSLKKARIMAENANHIKTAFIQNMSHEFRTPMNSIVGFAQLLCLPDGYVTDEEKAEYLGYIINNAQLLTVMVNDMLDIADMENGKYAVDIVPTNLNEVARQAIKSSEFLRPPAVTLIRQPGLDEDARYLTDGIRVQQILINFLTNAFKYATRGDVVFGSSLYEHPGYITFFVADNGPGVAAENAESIFERFVKLDNNKQGAGLGLSTCRMIAHSLGGRIWLDTQYTEGARFVLILPKVQA